ncbi:MAG: penicillin acylase family protein [Candidatus Marinimicrobia bacterium]|nr:penicillin acylase family protein [Candidatus Neomarinimicrobiota bacterium]
MYTGKNGKYELVIWILFLVTFSFCTKPKSKLKQMEEKAQKVKIYRDIYGVAHIYGPTDASVIFGSAYARAEDRFNKIDQIYTMALGKNAEAHGNNALYSDILVRAFEIPKLSKKEYQNASPNLKTICNEYADGINYYLMKNPDIEFTVIDEFKPWYIFAGLRMVHLSQVLSLGFNPSEVQESINMQTFNESNMWAISPKKSATGNAMLCLNPHLKFDEPYEIHLNSEEGLQISGAYIQGLGITPFFAYNEYLGWSLTGNKANSVDIYNETFDNPDDSLLYKYGDNYRKAKEWKDTIKVKTKDGVINHLLTFRKTHHGPILAERNGKHLAVKVAKMDAGGMAQQLYSMAKSKSMDEFKNAIKDCAIPRHNIMAAGKNGNIFYAYCPPIPRRNPDFDWSNPVNGSNPATEWKGYHKLEELPQVLNPESGFIQNCNTTPFTITDTGNPKRENFPDYIAEKEKDYLRAQLLRRILAKEDSLTFEEWANLAFDTYILQAEKKLPALFEEWNEYKKSGAKYNNELYQAIEVLANWNKRGDVNSIATTLFVLWHEKVSNSDKESEFKQITSLIEVIEECDSIYGNWRIPWGEINRLQRPKQGSYNDERNSLPIGGVNDQLGTIFAIRSRQRNNTEERYGYYGQSYVCVIEFGDRVKSKSITPFGQSSNPKSPHYFDQATLFAKKKFKKSWYYLTEIKNNLERVYHPGE